MELVIVNKTDKKEKRTKTLLVVLGSLTFLIMMMGSTFAYYTVSVIGNETASSIIFKSATLGISYDSGSAIYAEQIEPGYEITKTFTVTNTGDSSLDYKIKWVNVNNSFVVKEDLVYSLAGVVTSGTGTTSSVPQTNLPHINNSYATGTITIDAYTTHTFTMNVKFLETGSEQNSNQGRTFAGKIEIEIQ